MRVSHSAVATTVGQGHVGLGAAEQGLAAGGGARPAMLSSSFAGLHAAIARGAWIEVRKRWAVDA